MDKHQSFIAMEQYCAGRTKIKLPKLFLLSPMLTANFRVSSRDSGDYSLSVSVNNVKISSKEFLAHIGKRRAELLDTFSSTADILRLEKEVGKAAILFRIQEIDEAYRSELHFMHKEQLIIFTVDSYDGTFLAAEERLTELMAGFIHTDVNTRTGFCIGQFSALGDFRQESGTFTWSDFAGNQLLLEVDTYKPDDITSLLDRMTGSDSLLTKFKITHTVLRSRERVISGMRAQEWLGWTNLNSDGDEKTFKFTLETMRPKPAKEHPSLRLTFDSAQRLRDGTATRTNLSDEEAMALWDAIADSIQPTK